MTLISEWFWMSKAQTFPLFFPYLMNSWKNDNDHIYMFMVQRSSCVTFVTFSDVITCNLYFRPWIEPKKLNWVEKFELGLKILIEAKVGIKLKIPNQAWMSWHGHGPGFWHGIAVMMLMMWMSLSIWRLWSSSSTSPVSSNETGSGVVCRCGSLPF